MEEKCELPVEVINAVLQYLAKQPFFEVRDLILALQKASIDKEKPVQ